MEDRRSRRSFDGWRLVAALVVASLFFIGALGYAIHFQRNVSQHNCRRLNKLDDALTTILRSSQKALPANRFYRTHPAQLARARRELRRDLRLIRQARCIN